jgi:hypothetical protein
MCQEVTCKSVSIRLLGLLIIGQYSKETERPVLSVIQKALNRALGLCGPPGGSRPPP